MTSVLFGATSPAQIAENVTALDVEPETVRATRWRSERVDLLDGPAGADPALDVALPHALLGLVAEGRRGPVLRFYRPRATVAFGRRDSFLPGSRVPSRPPARRAFTPVVRGAGGRAAAYDEGCLVFDQVMPADDSMTGIQARFADEAELQARALRGLGVDARVGEVPGEYCPGEFSVNARGQTKLIGAAQRIVRGAWLLSSVVVVEPAAETPRRARRRLSRAWARLGPGDDGRGRRRGARRQRRRRSPTRSSPEYAQRHDPRPRAVSAAELAAANDLIARYRV